MDSRRRVLMAAALMAALMTAIIVAGLVNWRMRRARVEGAAGKTRANEVVVMCGGSMRGLLEAFLARHAADLPPGIRLVPTYGGSGDLCAQLLYGAHADILVSHDPFAEWLERRDLVERWDTVAHIDTVMAVPKGNPANIAGLADLARPGLRLGIGDRVYSTSGVAFGSLLAKLPPEQADAIRANIVMETKGHQERLNALILGHLDVAAVWRPTARQHAGQVDIVPLPAEMLDAVTSATYGESDMRRIKITVALLKAAAGHPAAREVHALMVARAGAIAVEQGFLP